LRSWRLSFCRFRLICDLMFAMKAGVYQCPLVQLDRGVTVWASLRKWPDLREVTDDGADGGHRVVPGFRSAQLFLT
jgi:hypothetical protein